MTRADQKLHIYTHDLDGGARIGICGLPGLGRPLESDIKTILDWQPALVLSLVTSEEFEESGSAGFGAGLQQNGVDWLHLPIADWSGLDQTGRERWPEFSAKLHEKLDDGEAVLLHCRGGQGRSGMIALRLLVERGQDHVIAFKQLRDTRPGAVETDEQLGWAISTDYL